MTNNPETMYSFAPELPEFEKLGRRFFPNVTIEEFWMILFTIEQGGLETVEELPWVEGIPAGFRTLFAAPLQFWEAFAWENVRCGLLRHNLTGFCRPVITDPEGDGPFVGPSLESFSPARAARACWQLMEACFCAMGTAPLCADFTNSVPEFVHRDEIKALFKRWAEDRSWVDAFFTRNYSETSTNGARLSNQKRINHTL